MPVTLAVTGIALLASGVLCWAMRPASRVGPMLCVTALLWWLPYLQQSEIDLVASCGYLARDLWLASLIHIVVTYPDGLGTGLAKVIALLAYARVLVPNLATALLAPAPPPLQNLNFFNVATEPAVATEIHRVATRQMSWLVGGAVLTLFVLRLIRGTRVSRMTMLPLSLRMISYVERGGEPVAAIVHDAALENEPGGWNRFAGGTAVGRQRAPHRSGTPSARRGACVATAYPRGRRPGAPGRGAKPPRRRATEVGVVDVPTRPGRRACVPLVPELDQCRPARAGRDALAA